METTALRLLGKKQINNGGNNKNHQYHQKFRLVHFGRYFTQPWIRRED